MPITIEQIPDAPILVVRGDQADRDVLEETLEVNSQISALLDTLSQPVFLVVDLREISMSLEDVLQVAIVSARGQDSLLHHPNIRENIFVMRSGLLRMAAKGLNNLMFGLLTPGIFDTLEEALGYCYGRLNDQL